MSFAAPKPFGGEATKNEISSKPSSTSSVATTFSYTVSTVFEKQLWEQVTQFSKLTNGTNNLQTNIKSAVVTHEFETEIKDVAFNCQEQFSYTDIINSQYSDIRERLVQLVSVQDDLARQQKESQVAINDQIAQKSLTMTARKEPLDAESQMKRNLILSKCLKVQNLIETLEECISLNRDIFIFSSNQHQEPLRPSVYFNQISSPKQPPRRQTSQSANNALFKSLTGQYDKARDIHAVSESLQRSVTRLSESRQTSRRQTPVSQHTRSPIVTSARKSISPLPTKNIASLLSSKSKPPKISSVSESNALLRCIAGDLSLPSVPKSFYLANRMTTANSVAIPEWRSKGKNELLTSSRAKDTKSSEISRTSHTSPVVKTLFSSPIAGSQPRSQWSMQANTASSSLKVNIPTSLKEVHVSDAAKIALTKFGTTPEKLAQGRDVLARDNAESNNATPKLPPKLSAKSAAAFPPMSSSAPKPVSQEIDQKQPKSTLSRDSIDYEQVLRQFLTSHAPEKVPDVEQYMQKYKGKESELFVALSKKFGAPNALNEVFLSRVRSVDKADYLALLTLFLQVFNPSKVDEAPGYSTKFKVCLQRY
jgi:hypothetical protein